MTAQTPRFSLYEHRASPFCVAARIALHEVDVPFAVRSVDLSLAKTTAILKRSPLGHLPVLVEHRPGGEGAIFESPAILLFLADAFPSSSLSLKDADSRAFASGWLFSLAAHFTVELWTTLLETKVVDEGARSPRLAARSRVTLLAALEVLDRCLAQRPYLAGSYSVADAFATPHLDLLELIDVDLDGLPRLRAWRERLRQRPSYLGAWASEDPEDDRLARLPDTASATS